jgi:hypothetical protein
MIKNTLLVSLLMLVLMVNIFALPAPVNAAPGAEITKVTGTVEVQKKGTTEWVKVNKTPYPVDEGDKVRAGKDSNAEITIDSNKVKVGADSTVELQKRQDPKTKIWKWVVVIIVGTAFLLCIAAIFTFWAPWFAGVLLVSCIVLGAVGVVIAVADAVTASAFKGTQTVQTFDEYGSLIAQTNIAGSLGLYANGTAWANGQQVSILHDDTISEPLEVSLSPSEAMELYNFASYLGVGGIVVPVDKFGLLAPYIGLASTILVGAVATAIYAKRVKRRKEKQ